MEAMSPEVKTELESTFKAGVVFLSDALKLEKARATFERRAMLAITKNLGSVYAPEIAEVLGQFVEHLVDAALGGLAFDIVEDGIWPFQGLSTYLQKLTEKLETIDEANLHQPARTPQRRHG